MEHEFHWWIKRKGILDLVGYSLKERVECLEDRGVVSERMVKILKKRKGDGCEIFIEGLLLKS